MLASRAATTAWWMRPRRQKARHIATFPAQRNVRLSRGGPIGITFPASEPRHGISLRLHLTYAGAESSAPVIFRWFTQPGVSDNVGAVKHFLSVLTRALRRARHFALVEDVALPYQPRPARNQFQVRNSVRPMHLFGHTFDHDY